MNSTLWLLLFAGSAVADISLPVSPPPAAVPVTAAAAVPAGFEAAPVLSATVLLGSEVAGPAYRVRERVPTDGYMAHFTIDSDYGDFECIGTGQTRARIHELGAIQKLVDLSKSDLFAEGVKRSLEQPIEAVKNIVKNPVESVAAVPKTLGHFFKKVGQSVGNAASNLKERIDGNEEPHTDSGVGNAMRGVIGFDAAKLACAKQLGVDPYTDNPRLQQEIEKVAWVFFSGGLPLRIGAAVVSGGASVALTASKVVGLPEEIYALTPAELTLKNQQVMAGMEVPEAVSRRYASNQALSITLRRSILRSLQAFGEVKNRAAAVEVAANCETRRQVEFLDQALILLVQRQQAGNSSYVALELIGRLPGVLDAKGQLLVAAPVDHLSWTPEVAEFAQREDWGGRKPCLLLGGGASERTRDELAARGWSLETH